MGNRPTNRWAFTSQSGGAGMEELILAEADAGTSNSNSRLFFC